MKTLTRTAFGAMLQASQLANRPFQLLQYTTLNEKFNVQAAIPPAAGVMPAVQYYCIGNGGHANATGSDGFPYTVLRQHQPTDAALFKHLPFVMRPVGQDLDPNTMANYALRTIITANGAQYVAYYLKRLNLTGVEPALTVSSVQNGVTSTQPYVPTSANLNPTPPPISSTGAISTNGSYITASELVDINFSANDVAELINCAQILYNNPAYAVISEVGLCSGVDQLVNIPANGAQPALAYLEAIAVQIATHVTAYYPVGSANQGVDIDVQIGAVEPLYGATNTTTSTFTPTA